MVLSGNDGDHAEEFHLNSSEARWRMLKAFEISSSVSKRLTLTRRLGLCGNFSTGRYEHGTIAKPILMHCEEFFLIFTQNFFAFFHSPGRKSFLKSRRTPTRPCRRSSTDASPARSDVLSALVASVRGTSCRPSPTLRSTF